MKRLRTIANVFALAIYAVCGLALVMFLVPGTGLQAKSVATGSMQPTIPTGSLVIIKNASLTEYNVGDIITYQKSAGSNVTVTHRLVAKTTQNGIPYFITKGDANPGSDIPVPGGVIIGKVITHVPYLGSITSAVKAPVALLLLVILPGILIIVNEIGRIQRVLRLPKPETVLAEAAQPPTPEPAPTFHTTAAVAPPAVMPAPAPRRKPMDSMSSRKLAAVAIVLTALSIGTTRAMFTSNVVSLTGTKLAVATSASPTPSPTPSPSPTVTPTPSPTPNPTVFDCLNNGWQNFLTASGTPRFISQQQCINFFSSSVSNTVVIVNNSNSQTARSGNVIIWGNTAVNGPVTSGSASNSNSSTTTINIGR